MYCYNLEKIIIPDSVTEIGSGAFYGYIGLTSVIIGNGVTLIDDEVFRECVELTSVIIGSGVTSIGSYTFGECVGLTSIEIPNIFEIAFKDSILGYPFPLSHLDTAVLET